MKKGNVQSSWYQKMYYFYFTLLQQHFRYQNTNHIYISIQNAIYNFSLFSIYLHFWTNIFMANCDLRFMHSKGHKTIKLMIIVLWLIELIMNWIDPIREHIYIVFNKPTNYWTNSNTNLRYIVILHIYTHLYHRRLTKTNWEIKNFKISHTTQLPNIFLLISTLFLFPYTQLLPPCRTLLIPLLVYSVLVCYTNKATIGLQWRVK